MTNPATTWTESMDGSPSRVVLKIPDAPEGPDVGYIQFQAGPIAEVGRNGTTIEAVLQVLIDRLKGFNEGPFRSRENSLAITALEEGQNWLYRRTMNRQAQGVEGRNLPHTS
jgi:hypothetical protein